MAKMVDKIKKNQSLIGIISLFLSILILIVTMSFAAASARADFISVSKDISEIKANEEKKDEILSAIVEVLKDNSRDHKDIVTLTTKNNEAILKLSESIIKMNSMMEMLIRKPLYQQLKED